jgi:hypothetical protein
MTNMLPTNPTLPHKPKQNHCIKLAYNQNHQIIKNKKIIIIKEEEEEETEEERKKEEKRKNERGSGAQQWSSPV